MPFFSIIIPVYNRAKLISATIDSVLEQVFDDYEILIINDGSTDDTEKVIQTNYGNNPKIKYIVQVNSERAVARNNGLKRALGNYAVFLDSDDLMKREYLSVLNQKIIEQNFPNFITTKYILKRHDRYSYTSPQKSLHEGYYDINLQLKGSVFGSILAVKLSNPGLKLFIEDRKYATIEDWMFVVQNLEHDKIYLMDRHMIIMNDHDDRSMRADNRGIVNKHIMATTWIESNLTLTAKQKVILWGNSYQFCAIHSYVDGRKSTALNYLGKSIRLIGLDMSRLLLLMKIIVGYKLIQKFKA